MKECAQKQKNESIQKLLQEIYNEFQSGDSLPKQFEKTEEELRYMILQQRLKNLNSFLAVLMEKYKLTQDDTDELSRLWFLYNDLKEIHFIGTDLYADVMFIKHKVPFLYRSVGRDNRGEQDHREKIPPIEIGKTIMRECLKQIESGGEGKLYSYSKCFGKMLFKYANIIFGRDGLTIEIRKDAWVNCIYQDGACANEYESLQKYIHSLEQSSDTEVSMPYFTVDMSNARADSVKNLKLWLDDYLGKQTYIARFKDIYDPIGDAEVVSNHTGENNMMCSDAKRYKLSSETFCKVLYAYGLKYAESLGRAEDYRRYITDSIQSIPHEESNAYYDFFKGASDDKCIDEADIIAILDNICWDNEKIYMVKEKEEKNTNEDTIAQINGYKENTSDPTCRIWKEIVKEAIRGRYLHTNCSSLK